MISNEDIALIYERIATAVEAPKKEKNRQTAKGTTNGTTPQIKVQQASPTMAPAVLLGPSNCPFKLNHACPQRISLCHWHHSTGKECNISWHHCPVAIKAIKAAFYEHKDWNGAPDQWNKCHAKCVQGGAKVSDMCYLHQEIHKEQELATLS